MVLAGIWLATIWWFCAKRWKISFWACAVEAFIRTSTACAIVKTWVWNAWIFNGSAIKAVSSEALIADASAMIAKRVYVTLVAQILLAFLP